uniref:Uncharacterized protein n=1 Tax=Ciona savignyi TaxID=51511 RepID=H2Z860_CIOSA
MSRKKKLFDHRRQSGFTAEPKWSYFKNLSFLDEFMQPRRSDITISPRAMTDVIVYAPFSEPHNDEDEEQQGEIVNYTDEALPSESRSSVVKRRLHTPIGRPSSSLMRQKKRKKMTMSDVDFEEGYDEMTQGGSAQYTEPMKEDSIPSLYARVVEVRLEEIPKNIHKAFFEISAILEKYEREENGFGEERSD